MPKDFTVAIVGGGIGGLTLAIGLLQRSIPVQIYEAAPKFKEVGLGLTIGPAAHRAMLLIDPQIRRIYDSLITTHADSPGYEQYRETWFEVVWATGSGQGTKSGEVLLDLKALPSGQTTVRRADFLDGLVSLIPPGIANFGKRLVDLDETADGVELQFEGGTAATADVVVGCDGIKSRVKQSIIPPEEYQHVLPRYSGMYGYRAVLDMDTMVQAVGDHRARVSTMYIGKGAYGISYPIMRAQKVNVGLYKFDDRWEDDAWVRAANKEDMWRDCGHMGDHVASLIKVTRAVYCPPVLTFNCMLTAQHMPDPSQWAIFEHPHISTYARSRIAILGDAAHASTPHQGAGAGQAIEDAHVLAELLGDSRVNNASHVITAFQAYDAVRRPRSQRVVTTSKENASLLCLCLDGVGDDDEQLKGTFQERLRWLWDIDVQEQAEQAKAVMAGDL